MALSIAYKGAYLKSLADGGTLTLQTEGKYVEGNIGIIEYSNPSLVEAYLTRSTTFTTYRCLCICWLR